MPIIEIKSLPRSAAAIAAIVGATRALERTFPVIIDDVVLNRLERAIISPLRGRGHRGAPRRAGGSVTGAARIAETDARTAKPIGSEKP